MVFLRRYLDLLPTGTIGRGRRHCCRRGGVPEFGDNIRDGEIHIPANAQASAEALGLKVDRSLTHGAWVRGVPRDEAEIEVECLRDYGVSARIQDSALQNERPPGRGITQAA
jgi:hydrogenase maturation factor